MTYPNRAATAADKHAGFRGSEVALALAVKLSWRAGACVLNPEKSNLKLKAWIHSAKSTPSALGPGQCL